jgi:hypothetical protein
LSDFWECGIWLGASKAGFAASIFDLPQVKASLLQVNLVFRKQIHYSANKSRILQTKPSANQKNQPQGLVSLLIHH